MHIHTFVRADGSEVIIGYRYLRGSMHGADGGDPDEVKFEDAGDLTSEELELAEEQILTKHADAAYEDD